jgi:hypothetical protein
MGKPEKSMKDVFIYLWPNSSHMNRKVTRAVEWPLWLVSIPISLQHERLKFPHSLMKKPAGS